MKRKKLIRIIQENGCVFVRHGGNHDWYCLEIWVHYNGEVYMNIELPIDKMSTIDKLSIMELLWDNLCQNPDDIPSPSWHGDILSIREKRVMDGKARFSDLKHVQERVQKACR